MASKNSIKTYISNGYYHVYNRGVEKRKIFKSEQDYSVFLSYLKEYLLPKNEKNLRERLLDANTSPKERDKILKLLRMNNFADEITLLAYCLMPNHFHILIKQRSANSLDRFMNSFLTRYAGYFNRKYKRVGRLFQDVYKAVLVESDPQLLYLTSYIHRNPLSLALQDDPLQTWQTSSYWEYLGLRKTEWVKPQEILSYFSKRNSSLTYASFVKQDSNIETIGELIIEID